MLSAFLLAVRRRSRARVLGRACGVVSIPALATSACTDAQTVPEEADDGSGSATASTSNGGESGQVPAGWPHVWYGEYHREIDFTLGQDYPGQHLFFGGLENMWLEPGSITIERFNTQADYEVKEWTLSTELVGDVLRVLPSEESWGPPYTGVDDVLVRPGEGCGELVFEIHSSDPPYEPSWSTRLLRGTLCLVDPYDAANPNDTWIIDLCPGTTTTCDGS